MGHLGRSQRHTRFRVLAASGRVAHQLRPALAAAGDELPFAMAMGYEITVRVVQLAERHARVRGPVEEDLSVLH
ncbi:hypothetical protein [Rhodococcus koreensis]|uniref:hypothetical protein n=1 Tax=Rhodococcus koreensis TaxID=99653 RepID=UPI0009341778|nr:hypothetical protein [Rhodococcus koreensis]